PLGATATQAPARVPLAITLYGSFLVLVGLGAGLGQYVAPTSIFSGLPEMSLAIQNVVWLVGSRSLAQAAALAIALGIALSLRDFRALGVVFIMRAITETQDMLIN